MPLARRLKESQTTNTKPTAMVSISGSSKSIPNQSAELTHDPVLVSLACMNLRANLKVSHMHPQPEGTEILNKVCLTAKPETLTFPIWEHVVVSVDSPLPLLPGS